MNRDHSPEEFEDVESPFATSSKSTVTRERIRNRKNVFNRPFAAEATIAPTVVEPTRSRRSIAHADTSELTHHRQSELAETEIDYLEDDEEEEIEKRPVRSTPKKAAKPKRNILPKIGWAVIGMLVLRLICMDRGVWDYFATEGDIREKQGELSSIHKENRELKTEITRLQVDKGFQRQLAKEHLGVIAADEFLILFAGESAEETPSETSL